MEVPPNLSVSISFLLSKSNSQNHITKRPLFQYNGCNQALVGGHDNHVKVPMKKKRVEKCGKWAYTEIMDFNS
ncbi:MAG: hypothetical protein J6S91_10315, partial [Treponema sp.]|nr:hypothetical protein [Treponema sp.]